jgi:sugar-phosphatase
VALILAADALLFDNDGVLVDSEGASLAAWGVWARHHGLDLDAVIEGGTGRRSRDTVALHLAAHLADEGFALIERLEVEVAAQTLPMPGALSLMSSVPDAARAVVTSGSRALATARLLAAGVPVPDVMVSGDDVAQGKPSAEPYLRAAELLGLPPSACVVFEDSENGIRAGRAAGAGAVVGVGRRALTLGCDAVVADLASVHWTGGGIELVAVLEHAPGQR